MLHGNVMSMKEEVCQDRSIAMACNESETTNPSSCVISRYNFQSLLLLPALSHSDSFSTGAASFAVGAMPSSSSDLKKLSFCLVCCFQEPVPFKFVVLCAVFFDLVQEQQHHRKGLIADVLGLRVGWCCAGDIWNQSENQAGT